MRRLQCAFELIAPNGAQRAGAHQERLGLIDQLRIPQRRILLGERHVVAVLVAPRAAPGFRVQHERKQAQRLRFLRTQFSHQPAQEHGFLGEIAAGDIGPPGVGPAFPERSVDSLQHGLEPAGKVVGPRDAKRDAGLPDLVLRAHESLTHGCRRHEER